MILNLVKDESITNNVDNTDMSIVKDPKEDIEFLEAYRGAKRLAHMVRSMPQNYLGITNFSVPTTKKDSIVGCELTMVYRPHTPASENLRKKNTVKAAAVDFKVAISIRAYQELPNEGGTPTKLYAQIVSEVELDGLAMAVLYMERAYDMINARATFQASKYFQILRLLPDLQLKFPELSDAIAYVISRMSGK